MGREVEGDEFGSLAEGDKRRECVRHGRRALRVTRARACVTDVIILRNWEPTSDICKPHACKSAARSVGTHRNLL